jgi:hypothetical protein
VQLLLWNSPPQWSRSVDIGNDPPTKTIFDDFSNVFDPASRFN